MLLESASIFLNLKMISVNDEVQIVSDYKVDMQSHDLFLHRIQLETWDSQQNQKCVLV